MDRASQMLPAGALVGTVLLAMGMALPHSAARASMPTDTVSLLTPGFGCGPAETLVGTGAPGLLARVRAEAAGAQPHRREAAKARSTGRLDSRKAMRPSAAAPRSARRAPRTEQEPRAAVLLSFYACSVAPTPNFAEGTGWRLVGPLRQG